MGITMNAKQAFGDLESKEFIVVDSIGNFFAPAKGRGARNKNQWTTELNEATVYKTWQNASKVIEKYGLEFAQYTSLKEWKEQN